MSHRLRQAALLVLLAVLAAVGVATLAAGTPLRILAGLALVLALPWLAASRLAAIRESDAEGGRISGSGGLAVALVILLGLLLSTGASGIGASGIAIGLVIVVAALAVIGVPSSTTVRLPTRNVLGLALTAIAVAIAVAAFAVARDRALTQARAETAYAAFLVEDGDRLDVGLSNSASSPARFTVREVGGEGGRATTLTVPAKSTGTVKGFLHDPPPLRPIERVTPRSVTPVEVRVTVRVGGRQAGPVLELSTYAP